MLISNSLGQAISNARRERFAQCILPASFSSMGIFFISLGTFCLVNSNNNRDSDWFLVGLGVSALATSALGASYVAVSHRNRMMRLRVEDQRLRFEGNGVEMAALTPRAEVDSQIGPTNQQTESAQDIDTDPQATSPRHANNQTSQQPSITPTLPASTQLRGHDLSQIV